MKYVVVVACVMLFVLFVLSSGQPAHARDSVEMVCKGQQVNVPGEWLEEIAEEFRGHYREALWVVCCESQWRSGVKNRTSSATGLFQMTARWWEGEFNPRDPIANIQGAAELFWGVSDGTWQHWECRPPGLGDFAPRSDGPRGSGEVSQELMLGPRQGPRG